MNPHSHPTTVRAALANFAAQAAIRAVIVASVLLTSALLYLPTHNLDLRDAAGTDPAYLTVPDVSLAWRAEGARQVGYEVWWSTGRNTLYPARRVLVRACRHEAASPEPCVAEWKRFYKALRLLGDASD